MELQKLSKLLNDSTASKFVLLKWIEVNELSGGKYSPNKNVGFKTPILITDLCDYSDAYVDVKRRISVTGC